ncbi:MAG: hypothetical protein ABFS30_15590, partial [Pseudomonadota bacterium]
QEDAAKQAIEFLEDAKVLNNQIATEEQRQATEAHDAALVAIEDEKNAALQAAKQEFDERSAAIEALKQQQMAAAEEAHRRRMEMIREEIAAQQQGVGGGGAGGGGAGSGEAGGGGGNVTIGGDSGGGSGESAGDDSALIAAIKEAIKVAGQFFGLSPTSPLRPVLFDRLNRLLLQIRASRITTQSGFATINKIAEGLFNSGDQFSRLVLPSLQTVLSTFTGFASGGRVPGVGNKDSVPALLMPGEFVIRKAVVNRFGAEFFEALNNGLNPVRKFAAGGAVASSGGSPGPDMAFTLNLNGRSLNARADRDSTTEQFIAELKRAGVVRA